MSNTPQNVDDAVAPSSPRTVTYDTESESRMSPQPPPDEEAQPYDESQRSSAEEDPDTVLRRHDTDALIDVIKKMMSEHADLASTVQRMRELYMLNERTMKNILTQLKFAETACRIVESLTDKMFAQSESNAAGGSIDSTHSTHSTDSTASTSVDDGAKKRNVDGMKAKERLQTYCEAIF